MADKTNSTIKHEECCVRGKTGFGKACACSGSQGRRPGGRGFSTGRGSKDEPGEVGRTVIAGTGNVEVRGTEESRVCLECRAQGEVGR